MPFGGPETAPEHGSLVGLGVGSGAELFPQGHSGGHGWIGRWRYGISEQVDAGIDVLGVQRMDRMAFMGKGAVRIRIADYARVDVGLGAVDDSFGKSIGGDLGIVIGTVDTASPWNYYCGLQTAGAVSVTNQDELPSTFYLLGIAGTAARPVPWMSLIFEGGMGPIVVDGHGDIGLGLYLGAGMLFNIPPTK